MDNIMNDEGYVNTMREAAQSHLSAMVEAQEMNLVNTLGLVPYRDGNAWCVLWGADLQVGIAGFGDTPTAAIWAFNKAMVKSRKEPTP